MMVVRIVVHGQAQLLERSVRVVGRVLNFRDGGHKEEDDARSGEQTDTDLEEKAFPAGFAIWLREGHRLLLVKRFFAARIIASARLECNGATVEEPAIIYRDLSRKQQSTASPASWWLMTQRHPQLFTSASDQPLGSRGPLLEHLVPDRLPAFHVHILDVAAE
jgi:hypothetical protein